MDNRFKALIFDVDGTLYSMRKMHFLMAGKLIRYYLLKPQKWKDLVIIKKFRCEREKNENKQLTIAQLCMKMSETNRISAEYISEVIERWLFQEPMDAIYKSRFKTVLGYIEYARLKGIKVYIYSDYPALDKINKLGISCENVFDSEQEEIHELKPSKNAMNYILSKIGVESRNILYVGDREEKDGESARLVDIQYCDIKKFRRIIKKCGHSQVRN